MVLDINLFRKEKGGNPDKIKESERKRYHDENNVDKVIEYDDKWRKCIFELEELKKNINMINKEIGNKKKVDKNVDVEDLKKKSLNIKEEIPKYQLKEKELLKERNKYISKIGNLLNIKVVCSDNEDNNKIVKTWGECKILPACEENDNSIHDNVVNSNNIKRETLNNEVDNKKKIKYYYHYDLLRKIGGANFKKGIQVAGHRGYYLTGAGFLLHNAILQYALNFLVNKKYIPVYPPFFMKKNIMEECAELDDFEETLYKIPSTSNSTLSSQQVSTSPTKISSQADIKDDTTCNSQKKTNIPSNEDLTRDDLFLIATSEQPLCALHKDETIESKRLPLKYAGFSSCFRKEAGAHGKDIRGILRVHQFDKVEQFCIALPQHSNKIHEEMIQTCEEFYQSLNIPYRIVSIVSGALNNAASIKYDLEGFFPTSNQYRELVSCSNCTDYQSINLNIRYSDSSIKINDLNKNTNLNDEMDSEYEHFLTNFNTENKYHVHLLNGTMVAAQRFLCCLLENYQNGEGIVVPEKLRPYMNNMDFIPFME